MDTSYAYMGYFDLVVFKVILGHSVHLSQNSLFSKTVCRRAKRTEIWDSGILVTHIWGAFDLVGYKVILGSFSALVSKWSVSQKWLAVEQNGVKLGIRRY